LGGLTGALIALWPDAESASDRAQTLDRALGVGDKAEPEPPTNERDENVATSTPTPEEPIESERTDPPQPAIPASTEEAPETETAAVQPPPPDLPERSITSQRESRSAREVRARERATAERQQRAAAKPGRLTVSVIPFGDIWINGDPWGPSPLRSELLKPGTYRISAGQGKPEQTRTVQLKAGERRLIEFDLTQ
jgi:hypothetical protein